MTVLTVRDSCRLKAMTGVWSVAEIRAAEEPVLAATQEFALMRRAAFAVAKVAVEMLRERTGGVAGRRVALLVGAGNNGGDALFAGAYLRKRGIRVTALLLAPDRAHPAGLAAFLHAGGRLDADLDADLIIDGIVGLSAKGPLRYDLPTFTAPVLSVGLPSGVDPDTGAVPGPAITATATVTFGGLKPGLVLAPGSLHAGQVHVVDLGLPLAEPGVSMLTRVQTRDVIPVPGPLDDKYSQGVTGIAAGSPRFPGAAVLATGGAVLATSGMVRFAGGAATDVVRAWPEAIVSGSITDVGRVQAWVIGPGWGTGSDSAQGVADVLAVGVPVLLDADALTLVSQQPDLLDARDPATSLLLTPHAGEFARLFGAPGPDPLSAVRAAAAKSNATVLLKGYTTIIAAPDGRALINPARSSWPATAGSGDVLSGVIGALLASGLDPLLAAGTGAYVHSLAAEIAASGAPAPASALLRAIPSAIRSIRVDML
jgi:hydroxyethylthiazole kinase-like uncharacterized protein yjeF